jgi:hypothetical protein
MLRPLVFASAPALLLTLACGSAEPVGDPNADYEEERVTVIGGDPESEDVAGSAQPGFGQCVDVGDGACVAPERAGQWCEREGGPYDLVVVDGEVVEVICYPPPEGGDQPTVVVDEGSGDVTIPQNENNTAIVFDESTDGEAIEGDIDVEGNNVSIYGNGPDDTIIDGDVVLSGNNVRLRGVTVTGNVTTDTNNVSIILCRVLGDIVLADDSTNNSVISANEIHGSLTSTSNNHVIVSNVVQGEVSLTGNNHDCADNRFFADENDDQRADADEVGDAWSCD